MTGSPGGHEVELVALAAHAREFTAIGLAVHAAIAVAFFAVRADLVVTCGILARNPLHRLRALDHDQEVRLAQLLLHDLHRTDPRLHRSRQRPRHHQQSRRRTPATKCSGSAIGHGGTLRYLQQASRRPDLKSTEMAVIWRQNADLLVGRYRGVYPRCPPCPRNAVADPANFSGFIRWKCSRPQVAPAVQLAADPCRCLRRVSPEVVEASWQIPNEPKQHLH